MEAPAAREQEKMMAISESMVAPCLRLGINKAAVRAVIIFAAKSSRAYYQEAGEPAEMRCLPIASCSGKKKIRAYTRFYRKIRRPFREGARLAGYHEVERFVPIHECRQSTSAATSAKLPSREAAAMRCFAARARLAGKPGCHRHEEGATRPQAQSTVSTARRQRHVLHATVTAWET